MRERDKQGKQILGKVSYLVDGADRTTLHAVTEAGVMWRTVSGRGRIHPGARQAGHAFDSGTPPGSVNCMSHEEVRGLEVDSRSDVSSPGCILYEILTA